MGGICSAEIETVSATVQLKPDVWTLLDQAPGIFTSRTWWDVVLSHAMPAGSHASFVVIRLAGRVAAVLPMLRSGRRLQGLTTPYTCEYAPMFAADLSPTARVAAMAAFARFSKSSGVVRLDAMDAGWDGLAALQAGARQAGLRVLRFDHFGNWHEPVAGQGWSGYLLRRPGAMRETIRRRLRRAEQLPDARFDLLVHPAQMDQAAAAFEAVYRKSWKDAEPYPAFNVALMQAMAVSGLLRFGLWSIGSTAVAVQLWVVKDGCATVLKLAHDEACNAHSPGTVLTAFMLRHLLDHEGVKQIDFGRGDDAYKRGWAGQRRQHIGLLLVNPWCADGAAALVRHLSGRVLAVLQQGWAANWPRQPHSAKPGQSIPRTAHDGTV